MNHSKFAHRFLLAAIGASSLCGCMSAGSGGAMAGNGGSQKWLSSWSSKPVLPPDVVEDTSPQKVKDPIKLQVAFAKWQESQGLNSEARQSYQQILEKKPKSVEALLGLARLDELAGRAQSAEALLAKAAKVAPKDATVAIAQGQLAGSQERWTEALSHFQRAVEFAPEDRTSRFCLGNALARAGESDAAVAEFARAVGGAEANYNVGYILRQQENPAADGYLRQALVLKPDLVQARQLLGLMPQVDVAKSTAVPASSKIPVSAPNPVRVGIPGPVIQAEVRDHSAGMIGSGVSPAGYQRPAPVSAPVESRVPAGMTPEQYEQWKNQQAGR